MSANIDKAYLYSQKVLGLSDSEYEEITGFNITTQRYKDLDLSKKALDLYMVALNLDGDDYSITNELLHIPLVNNKTLFSLMQQSRTNVYKDTILFACRNINLLLKKN